VPVRIKILPENLTNKIAAGEVVERPSSVVKELVENSFDAGSSEIIVEIEAGGKRLIRVTDDGCGMSREEALLSLERHATSKIIEDADLFAISTLGFRGEALPSVASVSRLTLATRERESIEGNEIYIEGGRIRDVRSCGMAVGTVISVRNLFFNTPARLRFLKSTATEEGHVGDLLVRMALSRPGVGMTFIRDGKTVFRVPRGSLADRSAALLGNSVSGSLHPVDGSSSGITVTGFVASPDCSRSAGTSVFTYVNGRFVRDRVVQHAVLQGYRSLLERGRYPVVVLFVEVPPGEVDVNVHPTKHEVRFRNQSAVHDAIEASVAGTLTGSPWLRAPEKPKPPPAAAPALPAASVPNPAERKVEEVREILLRYDASPPVPAPQLPTPFRAPAPPAERRDSPVPAESAATVGYFSSLTVIGQYNGAYLVCQDGSDLVLIDQHAAHERVAFQSLREEFSSGGIESQGLLFPETLELSYSESAVARERGEELARLGFELEHFGGSTWLLKQVPRLLSGKDYLRTLRDMLEEIQSLGRSGSFEEAVESILARVACHSVIRGSRPLSPPEIASLLRSMDETGFASACPHGRPVHRKMTLSEIERMFNRQ
jgi:DNA mismatch repair protein MutL